MTEKQLTVNLDGKDRVLDIGKFWFTKFFGQATGSDPLNTTDILLKPESQFDFVVNMVYAGMRTYCKVIKTTEDFTKEDVEGWLGVKEDSEITDLINRYAALTTSPGEGQALESGA